MRNPWQLSMIAVASLTLAVACGGEARRGQAGDAGGAPARVDGALQVVESFRFPVDFDQQRVGVFNTNTFWFQLDAFDQEHPLSWFLVRKKVGGADVVQFERLIGEITAFVPSAFLRVPRQGPRTRFEAIKTPEDLERAGAGLMSAWSARRGGQSV